MIEEEPILQTLEQVFDALKYARDGRRWDLDVHEIGIVKSVGDGVVRVDGLHHARNDELLRFPGGIMGKVFNLDRHEVGVILLDRGEDLAAGDEVVRTGRVLDVPVGPALTGRIVDALGRPLDDKGPVVTSLRWPVERDAPAIMKRAPVTKPLQTGIKAIDTLIPIGKGQRELILGDRQTGKTAIALEAILNQKGKDVLCVYCAIGKQKSAIAKVVADLKKHGAMPYSTVVAASADAPPGLQFVAAYAATSIAEYFFSNGRDVLIVYDDLTWHARAYRELSLLLRRPPGREAYPGDIFYVHARLLERATHLREEFGSGSLTALPIIETQAQNLTSYIPTNLISITDGQIYLSPVLFSKGQLPAIDVGKSVSRVGGRAQVPALQKVAGKLRLAYAQFQELETFSRFSTRLDDATRHAIEHGRRIRELLKQNQYDRYSQAEQFAVLLAATEGILDRLDPEEVYRAEKWIRENLAEPLALSCDRVEKGDPPSSLDWEAFEEVAREAVAHTKDELRHGTA